MAVTDSSVPPEVTEPTLFHAKYTLPEGYAPAAADAFMRFQLTRVLVWIQLGLMFVVFPIAILEFSRAQYGLWLAIAVDVIVLVLNIVRWVSARGRLANRLGRTAVAGAEYELTLTESTIAIRNPVSASTSIYRAFESATPFRGIVLLRVRGTNTRNILPGNLFTAESIAFLQSKVLG
jgi:hypothetical protein